MKLIELAEKIKVDNSEKLAEMNDKKIVFIIREALKTIKKELDKDSDYVIKIPSFGKFRVRMIEKEEDGEKVISKRIIFRPTLIIDQN